MEGTDEGLSSKQLSKIRSTVLEARDMIEKDIQRQLERYGVYEDSVMDIEELSYLDIEDLEKRKHTDAALEREMSATEDQERSYKNYVKEATYHHLNRLFALKLLEERDLVSQTLEKDPEFGNQSYLHRTIGEVAGELCDSEDEGFSYVLDTVYDEIGEEIGLLFEENDYTVIDLDFKVRKDVIELLNDLSTKIWGSDEVIGWMYQYFGEKEREEINEKIGEYNYKVKDIDIGVKTQLFTPRYIVEWLVDNSIGRFWLEMKENSNIKDECFYLSPLEESKIDRKEKKAKDIKVLDPSCGSGHMLFYAFDVLYEIYLEEGEIPEKYIPKTILEQNLYGIDIDPYAVQLAALSLYIKAKNKEPDVDIEQINIVPADAVLINGEKRKKILKKMKGKLEKKVVKQIWDSFENIREYGSLIKIEEQVDEILENHWDMVKKGQTQFTDEGLRSQTIFADKDSDVWDRVKNNLLEKVQLIAKDALEHNNPIEKMFAGELKKSVKLLDLFLTDYDIVITNPPYLDCRKMGNDIKKFTKNNYESSRDLYSSFIERCCSFSNKNGYISMVTPENFMFLHSYRKLRKEILSNYQIIEVGHLSGNSFNQQKTASTVIFVLRNRKKSDSIKSRFYRLTDEQNEYKVYENKINGLRKIANYNRKEIDHEDIYKVSPESFKKIKRMPFVYWFGQNILQLFTDLLSLGEVSHLKKGLSTGDNDRFLRKWWEINEKEIDRIYKRIQKSGTDNCFYDMDQDYIYWKNDGKAIKKHPKSHMRNQQFYFKEGLTIREFGSYLVSRKHYDNMTFEAHAPFIKSESLEDNLLIGLLNSSLYRFIANGINPSLNFGPGDAKVLPVKKDINKSVMIEYVQKGINYQKEKFSLNEGSRNYNPEFFSFLLLPGLKKLLLYEAKINSDIEILHGLIDNIVIDEYNVPEKTTKVIYENLPYNLTEYPHIINSGELDTDEYEFRSEVPTKELLEEEYKELIDNIEEIADKDLRDISEELEISPYTVAMVKHKHDLYTKDEKEEVAGRLLSYYLGCIMGRWDLEGLGPDDDGIVVFDKTFDDNVIDLIRECIELTYGEEEAFEKEKEIEDMLRKDIEDWMKNKFFRYHHCKEYRRRGQRIPIYWHLESEKGTFSCFVYYHKMDRDTFPKIRGQYLDKMIERNRNRLNTVDSMLNKDDVAESRKKKLRSEKEELVEELDDLEDLRERLDKLIAKDFEPDFEAGIWKNIQVVDEHDLLAVSLDKL